MKTAHGKRAPSVAVRTMRDRLDAIRRKERIFLRTADLMAYRAREKAFKEPGGTGG